MKHTDTTAELKFLVTFTVEEWKLLNQASRSHYDGVCAAMSQGGIIDKHIGICARTRVDSSGDWFAFRDLDILGKVAEMACRVPGQEVLGSALLCGISNVLRSANSAYLDIRKILEAYTPDRGR